VKRSLSEINVYSFQDKDFGCVFARGWPEAFQGVRRCLSLLPCEMNFLTVYKSVISAGVSRMSSKIRYCDVLC